MIVFPKASDAKIKELDRKLSTIMSRLETTESPKSTVGYGPVVKIVKNLVTGDTVYHVNKGDGFKILQEYVKS